MRTRVEAGSIAAWDELHDRFGPMVTVRAMRGERFKELGRIHEIWRRETLATDEAGASLQRK